MKKKKLFRLYIVTIALILAAVVSVCAVVWDFSIDDVYRTVQLSDDRCGDADGGFAFYNVGNGDGSAVYTNEVIGLVDTGTPEYARSLCDELKNLTENTIDFIIISHPHADHAGGYEYLLQNFTIGQLYIREYTEDQLEDYDYYQHLLDLSKEKGVKVIHPSDRLAVQVGDIQLTFYSPVFYTEDENERCLLTMAAVGQKRCLYTGDSGILTEDVLISNGYDIKADLLKIGHHGSKTATSKAFLEAVDPSHAVICVGYNSYGHPSDQVTEMLTAASVEFYRTDTFSETAFFAEKNQLMAVCN